MDDNVLRIRSTDGPGGNDPAEGHDLARPRTPLQGQENGAGGVHKSTEEAVASPARNTATDFDLHLLSLSSPSFM